MYLVYSEIHDFVNSGVKFHFAPDDELDTRMDLNVDLTVAMPCRCNDKVFRFLCFTSPFNFFFQILEQMCWIQLAKV